jgi:hypothetical protein
MQTTTSSMHGSQLHSHGRDGLITSFSGRFEQISSGAVCSGHLHGHESCKQGFGCKGCQSPDQRRSYAAPRGEISGALVCGSSKRAIRR